MDCPVMVSGFHRSKTENSCICLKRIRVNNVFQLDTYHVVYNKVNYRFDRPGDAVNFYQELVQRHP